MNQENRLKRILLSHLSSGDEYTVKDISVATGEEIHNVYNGLRRLLRNSLVTRQKRPYGPPRKPNIWAYEITLRGRTKLAWYNDNPQYIETEKGVA